MVDSINPLIDDDDEEYEGEFSSAATPEELGLPSEIPPVAFPSTLPDGEPISDDSELPDLSSMLGAIDLGNTRLGSGVNDESYASDAFDIDPFSSEPFGAEEEEEPISSDPFASASSSIFGSFSDDDLLIDDLTPPAAESPRSIDDYSSPRSHEDDYDFEGANLDLDSVIALAIDMGASDIHLSPGDRVAFSILGNIHRVNDFGIIDPNMTVRLQQTIISNVLEDIFVSTLELDTSYVVKSGKHKGRRLRLSVGKSEGNVMLVFRIIADVMPTPDELDIPQSVRNWVNLPGGLVLVNGPTGSGKSTTLSSLMQEIQLTRAEKIITIEKPIEYMYGVKEGQDAFITQREVGRDTRSFAAALTSAMRQAPNIILVGEVRNREEIDELLRAAETGHLAISTMHTKSAPATIGRIRSMYTGEEQNRVLATLAENLQGMMNQVLVKSPDGKSRYAVREVLQITPELQEYILNGDAQSMRSYQERNGITMEHELIKAVRAGRATIKDARAKAPNPFYFDELLDD